MKNRGFDQLKGKSIKTVRAACINQVEILCDDGTLFLINAEPDGPLGLPVISAELATGVYHKLPRMKEVA